MLPEHRNLAITHLFVTGIPQPPDTRTKSWDQLVHWRVYLGQMNQAGQNVAVSVLLDTQLSTQPPVAEVM